MRGGTFGKGTKTSEQQAHPQAESRFDTMDAGSFGAEVCPSELVAGAQGRGSNRAYHEREARPSAACVHLAQSAATSAGLQSSTTVLARVANPVWLGLHLSANV